MIAPDTYRTGSRVRGLHCQLPPTLSRGSSPARRSRRIFRPRSPRRRPRRSWRRFAGSGDAIPRAPSGSRTFAGRTAGGRRRTGI